jgi:ribose transport system permease protein
MSSTFAPEKRSLGQRAAALGLTLVSPRGAAFLLLIVLVIAITVLNPNFAQPDQLVRFIQRVAPVALVAIGQYFVIVSGEFDLSQGSVITTQVVVAASYIGQDDSRILPGILMMVGIGLAVGLINGLVTTLLKVPSFIVTLGMMLALLGAAFWLGGLPSGNPTETIRQLGRGGIRDLPVINFLPWSVIVLVIVIVIAIWFARRPFGRAMKAAGDNVVTAEFAGIRVWAVKTGAFVISSLSATLVGLILVGSAGVHQNTGRGYEFIAITAVVLGGVVLGGGRGWVVGAIAGAFALEALFMLLNFTPVPATYRDAIQGVIIIAAVAYAAVTFRSRRRPSPLAAAPAATPETSPERELGPDVDDSTPAGSAPHPSTPDGTAKQGGQ